MTDPKLEVFLPWPLILKSKQHYSNFIEIITLNLLTTCDKLIGKSIREEHCGISNIKFCEESVKDA